MSHHGHSLIVDAMNSCLIALVLIACTESVGLCLDMEEPQDFELGSYVVEKLPYPFASSKLDESGVDPVMMIHAKDRDDFVCCTTHGMSRKNGRDILNLEAAIKYYGEIVAAHKDAAYAYAMRGACSAKLGKNQSAIEDLTIAINLEPRFATAWSQRGAALAISGSPTKAGEDLEQSLKIKPRIDTYRNRAWLWAYMYDFPSAIEDLSRAIELAPRSGELMLERGKLRILVGDFDLALQDINVAIEIMPNSAEAFEWRAQARSRREDFEEAIEDYSRAIVLQVSKELLLERASTFIVLKRYDDAIADCTEILARYGQDSQAAFYRGQAYYEAGKYEEALTDISYHIHCNSGSIQGAVVKSSIYFYAKDPRYVDADKGISCLKELCEATGWANGNVIYSLAKATRQFGDSKEAVTYLERALLLPNNPESLRASLNLSYREWYSK